MEYFEGRCEFELLGKGRAHSGDPGRPSPAQLHTPVSARSQIEALMASHDDAELHELGEAAVADIDAWEQQIIQLKHDWPEQEAIEWVSSLVSDR